MKNIKTILWVLIFSAILSSCKEESSSEDYSIFEGKLTKRYAASMVGFEENREAILAKERVSMTDFIEWSTDSAWSLPFEKMNLLKSLRTAIGMPDKDMLLQKIISLEDIPIYMNNVYGGTVGGFVSVASDMKRISTMYDTFWGLRLDYSKTKFSQDGAGYAVIRFFSDAAPTLTIPFCPEMGGTQPHSWPNTGGGFTASTLGKGGYPEYVFKGYSAPREGAELYEVTPQGREILRSTFVAKKGWQTNEIGSPAPYNSSAEVRNGVYRTKSAGSEFITTMAIYGGNKYIVRGKVGTEYHLTTQTLYEGVDLEVIEKGVYGIKVPINEIDEIWEESETLPTE